MHTEIEERVLEIDEQKIIRRLEELHANKIGEWNQKRYVYDFNPKRENQWIRLRDSGDKVTLAYKSIEKDSIDGTKEIEIEVSDFEETNKLLEVLGYKSKAFQENKRIQYKLGDVEIDIDYWPLIPAYLEIEGKTIADVKRIAKLLNINENNITSLNCKDIYQRIYGINIDTISELKF